jgi:hypothetical protein
MMSHSPSPRRKGRRDEVKLIWQVEPEDVKRLQAFYRTYGNDPMVRERRLRNLSADRPKPDRAAVWYAMIACLLTTQQRSGPESATTRFISTKPFPLAYEHCAAQPNLEPWAAQVLSNFGGLRRHNRIADELNTNLAHLEDSLWDETLALLDELRLADSPELERDAAAFVSKHFKGFGPKQSRNLLQSLGLTRYEIPIDSRIVKWLNEFGFPIHLTAGALSDPSYFDFVSDGFQQLCLQSELVPCLVDAAIFSSFDKGGWTEENVVW